MELRDYVKIIGKNIWLVVLTAVLVGVLAFIFASKEKTIYNGFLSITVDSAVTAENANFYQYDGYYSASTANLQARGLSSWLNTPTSVAQIYESSNQVTPEISSKNLKDYISVKNDPDSNVVLISMSDSSKIDLEKRLESISDIAESYFSTAKGSDQFSLKSSDNSITSQKPNSTMNAITGVIAGLIIGIVLVFGKEYFSKS